MGPGSTGVVSIETCIGWCANDRGSHLSRPRCGGGGSPGTQLGRRCRRVRRRRSPSVVGGARRPRDGRAVDGAQRTLVGVHRPQPLAVLRCPVAAANVHRAGLVAGVHVLLCHRGGALAPCRKGADPAAGLLAVRASPGIPRDHHHRVHRVVSRLAAGFGMRVDLRDLHLAGVEHDIRVLPIADRPTQGSRRGIPAVAAVTMAAVLAGRPAQRGDPAGLERHDEFRRGLVFPHRVGSLERQQPQVRPARDRRLRRSLPATRET